MSIEELKSKFIVDDDVVAERLEQILQKALQHCVVDKKGNVHINNTKMSATNKVKLVLAARRLASQLDESIPANVSPAEIAANTGMAQNIARARLSESVNAKFAESSERGAFRAIPHKIEAFLDELGVHPD